MVVGGVGDLFTPAEIVGLAYESGDVTTKIVTVPLIDLLNVYDICAKPVISVGEDLGIKHVAKLMTTHRVKRLLVVNNNELVAMIAMNDLMEKLLNDI